MSQKILKFIVIFLAILIFLCFIALIYGLYIKSAKKQTNLEINDINYSLNLQEGDEIIDIDLINKDKLLFTIKNNNKIYALIYDIQNKESIKIKNKND
ncbi:hypothetical protein OA492_02160 [Pelagibacteraceae bacterium]|nr:hypothetical protein [Pelagibacteraceae bacterium]